jgi:uncharacterized protein YprB with RNaseH-like and TPR domain
MVAPIRKLKKDQLVKLHDGRCKHGHTYIEHYQCFLTEKEEGPYKIGSLDIETSNLNADYGVILTWCIKDHDTGEIYNDQISEEDLALYEPGEDDTRIVASLIEAMMKFDELVTWYGARFDIPFIRTRANICKVDFPKYGAIKHKDLWFTCRGKLKLSSNRLENACKVILGKSTKTRLDAKHWRAAQRGNKESLAYVLTHNKHDVEDLKKIYEKIVEYGRPVSNSI